MAYADKYRIQNSEDSLASRSHGESEEDDVRLEENSTENNNNASAIDNAEGTLINF